MDRDIDLLHLIVWCMCTSSLFSPEPLTLNKRRFISPFWIVWKIYEDRGSNYSGGKDICATLKSHAFDDCISAQWEFSYCQTFHSTFGWWFRKVAALAAIFSGLNFETAIIAWEQSEGTLIADITQQSAVITPVCFFFSKALALLELNETTHRQLQLAPQQWLERKRISVNWQLMLDHVSLYVSVERKESH